MDNNMLDARAMELGQITAQTNDLKQKLAQMPRKVTSATVKEAVEILKKYKDGKSRLEKKIIANEQFWKLRQWAYFSDENEDAFNPATAWLWYMIQSRYSDAMDSYPTCNIKARQEDDVPEADKMSSIIPVVMEQNRFEDTYSDLAWYTLKHGGGVYGCFWDSNKHNGLGDILIKKIDLLNIFWESGITDIQDSENIFTTELVSNRILNQMYPQTEGRLGGKKALSLAKYMYDDKVDTTDKSIVVDWYYHTIVNGRKTLQYVKFVNDIVLYATENEIMPPTNTITDDETGVTYEKVVGESLASKGLYDHAKYPFVVQNLYPIEGSIIGYGITDIGRDTQIQIDLMNKAILENTLAGAKPRNLVKDDGTVNMDELRDVNCDVIHVDGDIGEAHVRTLEWKSLDTNYLNVYENKITELKQVTSNQDVSNGINPNGVTAGSAISALQEVAGKNARSSNKEFHRAYRDVIYQVIELIRQFYTLPRTFRITGKLGDEYATFSNEGIRPQPQNIMGMDMGLRLPEFDIEVTSEKASPYKKMEQNELAINFYNLGFFNPQMATMALQCLDMMDFEGKDQVSESIRQNGTLYEMLLHYQQIALELAMQVDPALANQIGEEINREMGGSPQPIGDANAVNLDGGGTAHPLNAKAREQARTSTQAD